MSHIFARSCKTVMKMKKYDHQIILLLFVFGCFMIERVKGRINPLVNLSTRDELVHVAGYGEEKLSTVIITGQVLRLSSCVDAQAQLPHPISGASVVVLCGRGKKKKEWGGSITDEYGDFFIDLPSHLHAIPNLEKFCYVIINRIPKNNKKMLINSINNSSLKMPKKQKRRNIKLISIDDGIRTYTTESIHIISKPNKNEEARNNFISSS